MDKQIISGDEAVARGLGGRRPRRRRVSRHTQYGILENLSLFKDDVYVDGPAMRKLPLRSPRARDRRGAQPRRDETRGHERCGDPMFTCLYRSKRRIRRRNCRRPRLPQFSKRTGQPLVRPAREVPHA